jgi:hypothetical protein
MGQINPYSGYSAEAVSLDRRLIGDREGRQPRREPKRPKPQPQAEDQVELHGEAEQAPEVQPPPVDEIGDSGHVDITA